MLIGELSKKTGFSRDTIRYYEKLGLIGKAGKSGDCSSYKNYPESVFRKLVAIRQIKAFGFTLKEMHGLFVLFEERALDYDRGIRYVKRKISAIDEKIKELKTVQDRLQEIIHAGKCGKCPLDKILEAAIMA